MQNFCRLFLCFFFLASFSANAQTQAITATSIRLTKDHYAGNPGAQIKVIEFSDGMKIQTATYDPAPQTQPLTPIGVVAGYGTDFSYLHFLAKQFSAQGHPVFLVHPPGNGNDPVYSGYSDHRDGYHNTIEGFATMYMEELGRIFSENYAQKILLMGHSRGGYQMRVFLSGLRYVGQNAEGKPVLEYQEAALNRADKYFLAIVSLYSPLRADPRLIEAAKNAPAMMKKMNELDLIGKKMRQKSIDDAARLAEVMAATSPLNLIWGIFAPIAASVNGRIAGELTRAAAEKQSEIFEALAFDRTTALLLGKRRMDHWDKMFLEMGRKNLGSEVVPSLEELEKNMDSMKWILGEGVNSDYLKHVLKFGNRNGPTTAAAKDMESVSGSTDLMGWRSIGVDNEGNPFSILRSIHRALRNRPFPYIVVAADGDGPNQGIEEEKKFLKPIAVIELGGGHGGAVLSGLSLSALSKSIAQECKKLLAGEL